MSDIWFISDTHFGHKNILNFTRSDGKPLRDFKTVHDMDMTIVENWNAVVKPSDKIYHLGDVEFSDAGFNLLSLLNGHKRLVRGNHDHRKTKQYLRFFEEIYGIRQIDGFWFTHVPMNEGSVEQPRVKANVHGHLHANRVMKSPHHPHPNYINVCVECIDYTPINFDQIKSMVDK